MNREFIRADDGSLIRLDRIDAVTPLEGGSEEHSIVHMGGGLKIYSSMSVETWVKLLDNRASDC